MSLGEKTHARREGGARGGKPGAAQADLKLMEVMLKGPRNSHVIVRG